MSVINQMLKALDARRAAPPVEAAAGGVVPPPAAPASGLRSRRVQMMALAGAALVSAAAFGNWPALQGPATPVIKPVGMGAEPLVPAVATLASAPEAQASAAAPPRAVAKSTNPPEPVAPPRKARVAVAEPDALALRAEPVLLTPSSATGRPAPERSDKLPPGVSVEKKLAPISASQRAQTAYAQASELAASGHSSQALDHALNAVLLDPDHLPSRQLVAVLLCEARRLGDAAALLQDGLQRQPQQPQFAYLLARIKAEGGDAPGALAVLSSQQALTPDGHTLRAGVLVRLGRHREAASAYEAAVNMAPDNAAAWMGLGIALDAEGRASEARLAFQRARAIGSLQGELLTYLDQKLAALR